MLIPIVFHFMQPELAQYPLWMKMTRSLTHIQEGIPFELFQSHVSGCGCDPRSMHSSTLFCFVVT
jgi:hypothetical protein